MLALQDTDAKPVRVVVLQPGRSCLSSSGEGTDKSHDLHNALKTMCRWQAGALVVLFVFVLPSMLGVDCSAMHKEAELHVAHHCV